MDLSLGGEPQAASPLVTVTISGTPVTTATDGVPYAGFSVAGYGGTLPYVYSLSKGTFPSGMTINSSTGAVSGNPTTPGSYGLLVITVTDANSLSANLSPFVIVVGGSPTGEIFTPNPFNLALTSYAPLVPLYPGIGSVVLTSYAPVINRIGPPQGSLGLTGQAAGFGLKFIPGALALALSTYAATRTP